MTERNHKAQGQARGRDDSGTARRDFLKTSVAAVAGGTLAGATLPAAANTTPGALRATGFRAGEALGARVDAARRQYEATLALPRQRVNGDDRRYADNHYYASFTKALPHNAFGEVEPDAYQALLRAQRSGASDDFDAVPLDPTASRKLANPQGAYRFIFAGLDGHATRMRPAPRFRSARAAAEMGEVYWQALTRDVPFNAYATDGAIAEAVDDLNSRFSYTIGPTDNGTITPATLFRGPTPGDLTGPYLSQFLWLDVPYGPSTITQRYERPLAAVDFMVDEDN
ncbi:MAG: hypothetical protein AAGD86_14355, partial [Pseudomonadota bacterium]